LGILWISATKAVVPVLTVRLGDSVVEIIMPFLAVLTLFLGDGFLAPVVDNARKYRFSEPPGLSRRCRMPTAGINTAARRGCTGQESTMTDDRLERQQIDAGLVKRWSAGSKEAFQELTERYYRPVCAFLWKRVQRTDLVEDLAQETFLEAFRSLKSLSRPEQFSNWLFGIARNRCGKWLRRPQPALFPASDPPDVATVPFVSTEEELEEQKKIMDKLETGLAGLTEESRALLNMKHRQGKTCAQIAAALGKPVGTIKSLLSRAYKTLRERMCPEGGVP
jgi:RNA polymerase sigma-70 factor (ECF subfamily)